MNLHHLPIGWQTTSDGTKARQSCIQAPETRTLGVGRQRQDYTNQFERSNLTFKTWEVAGGIASAQLVTPAPLHDNSLPEELTV